MKRNFIKLVKNPKEAAEGKEALFETYVSPQFVPYGKMYEAIGIIESKQNEGELTDLEASELMLDFIVDIYGNKFTKEQLLNGLHAPNANEEIENQVKFFAQGVQSDEQKKELKALLK